MKLGSQKSLQGYNRFSKYFLGGINDLILTLATFHVESFFFKKSFQIDFVTLLNPASASLQYMWLYILQNFNLLFIAVDSVLEGTFLCCL